MLVRSDVDGDQTIGKVSEACLEVWSPLSHGPRSSLPAAVLAWLAARLAHLAPPRPPGRGGTRPLPLEVLWVPVIRSPHATCAYSWISPPSRSRRTIVPAGRTTADSLGPSGGICPKARCGR
jgi:hypothetical protein